MKSKIFHLNQVIVIILILLVTQTCKKDEIEIGPDELIIADETNVIPAQAWDTYFESYDTTSNTLTFSAGINGDHQIETGDIIISDKGEGLLRKVSSIQTSNNKTIVKTTDASLTDVIEQGSVEFESTLTVSQIKSIDYHYKGVSLKNQNLKSTDQTQFNWNINVVLYDNDGQSATTADQIKLVGDFTCDWTVKAKIKIGLSQGIKEINFGYESSEELDLELIAGLEYELEKKITLATVNFTPIIVTVGVVPVVFTPQLKIIAGVDGYANASITTGIEQSLSFNAGILYTKDGGWNPYSEFDKSFNFQPPQLNLNAGAEAYLKPELNIKVYAVAGPYVNLKLYSKLDADLLKTPWWELYAGLNMNAGAKIEILDRFMVDFEIEDILTYEILLAQAESPPILIPTVTTNDISEITQTTATSGGNVTDNGGATVTARGVCWSTNTNPDITDNHTNDGNRTGEFTSSLIGLTENTTYYVRAYATNSAGTKYGDEVSFITNENSTAGLIAYYPFNGNANDESGNGLNGTANGASLTTDRFGNENSAYSFDGINDKIEIQHSDLLNLSSGFSFSVWIKASSWGTYGYARILAKMGVSGDSDGYDLKLNNNTNNFVNSINCGVHSGATYFICYGPDNCISLNEYYHIVATYDRNTFRLYVNNNLVTEEFTNQIIGTNTHSLTIGYYPTRLYSGIIDDIRIYDGALTESDIQTLYHEGGW